MRAATVSGPVPEALGVNSVVETLDGLPDASLPLESCELMMLNEVPANWSPDALPEAAWGCLIRSGVEAFGENEC